MALIDNDPAATAAANDAYVKNNPNVFGGAPATPTVMRYTDPVSGQPMQGAPAAAANSANPPAATGYNPAPVGTPSYATGNNPIQQVFAGLPTAYPTAGDESTIRQSIGNTMQTQVDAINKYYNSLMQTQVQPQMDNITGAARASNARAGLLGSDFGDAEQQKANSNANNIRDQFEAERQMKLQSIQSQIDERVQNEVNSRKQAAVDNGKAYIDYLQGAQKDARQNVQDLASIGAVLSPEMKSSLLKDSGYDPMTFDAIFNAHRQASQQVKYNYTNLGNGTVLRTGVRADGMAVPEQTFQYQLGPNDQFEISQNGTPLVITKNGNQITNVRIADGFQQGDLASKYTPVYSNGNVSLLNTLTGDMKGTDFSGSQQAPQGGFRTDRMSNPTAMTTDVAAASGLVEGKDYVKGDPFTTSSGQTLYTAKLLGDPIQTTIKALDQGGFYTQSGQPRWSYLSALPPQDQQAIKNWQSASVDQKTQVVKDMYQHEGGSGALFGGDTSKTFNATDPTDALAATYLQGGAIPKGNGKTSASAGVVTARANEIAAQLGIVQPGEAFDATALKADQKANMKVLLEQVPQKAQIQANLDAADANFQKLTGFMQQYGLNDSNVPIANQIQQYFQSRGISGPQATAATQTMQSALAGLATEYSQILARGGQRNETIDKEAQKLVPGNLSPSELQMVVNYIKSEGQNVLKSKDTAIENAKKSFGNPTSQTSQSSSNDPLGIR